VGQKAQLTTRLMSYYLNETAFRTLDCKNELSDNTLRILTSSKWDIYNVSTIVYRCITMLTS